MNPKYLKSLPVYNKALEIRLMSREIVTYISCNKDLLSLYKSKSLRDNIADSLLTDAILIPEKIALAEASNSYAVRMKNARFINVMTRNILSYCNGLEKDGVKEKEYLNLLRGEIKKFRASFKEWRRSIRKGGDSNSWGVRGAF